MNTNQPLGIQHRKRKSAPDGLYDGLQGQKKKKKPDADNILCSQIEADTDGISRIEAENDKYDQEEMTEMTEIMEKIEMLKLEREMKAERQIKDGNWIEKYRCKSCFATISSEGICEKCEENKKERKRDLPKKHEICEDWLDRIL